MENAFSLETVLRWAAEESGKGRVSSSERQKLTDIVREALDALFAEQPLEGIRCWCLNSCGCSVTLPREMGDPVKYKVCDKVGPVRSKLYDFRDYCDTDCLDFKSDLKFEKETPLTFELPEEGGRVYARALEHYPADCKPQILVQGEDFYGKEVFHKNENGVLDVGELLTIAQPNEEPVYSKTHFKKGGITSVRLIDSALNVQFNWCHVHEYGQTPHRMGLLSFYEPGDEYPCFRKYTFPVMDCSCCYKIEILACLKPPRLSHPNELIRGFSSNAIRNMIRAIRYNIKGDIGTASGYSNIAATNIRKNNEKKNKEADIIDFFGPTSGCSFRSIS